MQTNIHAYTEIDYQPASYPAYISLNQRHADGSIWLTVRSRDGQTASQIELTPEQLEQLHSDVATFLFSDAMTG